MQQVRHSRIAATVPSAGDISVSVARAKPSRVVRAAIERAGAAKSNQLVRSIAVTPCDSVRLRGAPRALLLLSVVLLCVFMRTLRLALDRCAVDKRYRRVGFFWRLTGLSSVPFRFRLHFQWADGLACPVCCLRFIYRLSVCVVRFEHVSIYMFFCRS